MIAPGNIITINGKRYEAHNFQYVNKDKRTDMTDPCSQCDLDALTCHNYGAECINYEFIMYFKEKK
jgi:hypothetical protein